MNRPPDQQLVAGETGHKYFHQMLNMAEDDLDPFQYRLLGHYLRSAGHNGILQETIKETAAKCHMSEKKASSTRAELVELGYLHVYEPTLEERGDGIPAIVEVLDRWLENIQRYTEKQPTANMHEVVEEATADMPEPPTADLRHIEDSKYLEDKDSKDHAPEEGAVGGGEVKKERKLPSRSAVFDLLALESFGIADVSALDKQAAILINMLERWLKNNSPGATVETVKAFYTWYDRQSPGAARPRNVAKFGTRFLEFRQQHLITKKVPPEVIRHANAVPDEWGVNQFVREAVGHE